MKTEREFEITQAIIDSAERDSPSNCVVALAIKQSHPSLKYLYVGIFMMNIPFNTKEYFIELPKKVSDIAIAFDRGEVILPQKFTISADWSFLEERCS